MALRTDSVKAKVVDEDRTPEYEVRLDSEGKGYLAKKEVAKVEEPKVEEPKVKVKRRKKK